MYDTRLDYARVMRAYEWLKGQGSEMIWDFSHVFCSMLADRHQQDNIVTYSFVANPDTLDQPCIWNFGPGSRTEAESIIEWILNDWADRGGGR